MKIKLQCLLYGKGVVTYHSLCVVIFRKSPGGGDYLLTNKNEINLRFSAEMRLRK